MICEKEALAMSLSFQEDDRLDGIVFSGPLMGDKGYGQAQAMILKTDHAIPLSLSFALVLM